VTEGADELDEDILRWFRGSLQTWRDAVPPDAERVRFSRVVLESTVS